MAYTRNFRGRGRGVWRKEFQDFGLLPIYSIGSKLAAELPAPIMQQVAEVIVCTWHARARGHGLQLGEEAGEGAKKGFYQYIVLAQNWRRNPSQSRGN